jgi:hypothetical protein
MFIASLASAGETILFENFDKMDLKNLPSGWSVSKADDLSIVDEAGRGKVLKISHKGNGWPSLNFNVDPAKLKGKLVRVSAAVKFPGTYTPMPDKAWARPKFFISYKDKGGADKFVSGEPEQNKPDWQTLFGTATVEPDVGQITASLRIDLVAAEVYFDDFAIEVEPDLNAAPPKSGTAPATTNPAATTTPPKPATGGPATAPAAAGNDALAKSAPKKTFEDGGFLFSPEIAANLQKNVKAGATKNTVLMIGPGLPHKDLESKLPEKWVRVPTPKELMSAAANPRALLAVLPKFLIEHKPEVVVLVPENAPGRKPSSTEQYDWEDLARICQRLGAVPVLTVPTAAAGEAKDDLHAPLMAAAGDSLSPGIDMKAPSVAPRRLLSVLDLLEKHVYCRTAVDAPTPGATPKKPEEE